MFIQFKPNCNPLDHLIEEFYKQGWYVLHSDTAIFGKYRWPKITFSPECRTYDDLPCARLSELELSDDITKIDQYSFSEEFEYDRAIELMGEYSTLNDSDVQKEGTITLYYEKIMMIAHSYMLEEGLSLHDMNDIISELTTIILYHEGVHWMMHWLFKQLNNDEDFENDLNRPKQFDYTSKDAIYFHEAFAQLLTFKYCEFDLRLKHIFIWLQNNQPPQYHAYLELDKVVSSNVSTTIELIHIFQTKGIQSFEAVLNYYKKHEN